MRPRSTLRSSHRLTAVVSSFSLVAGIGVAVIVGQSLADGPPPVPRLSLGPNLIENSGFGAGLDSWSRSDEDATAISIIEPGAWGSAHAVRMHTNSASTAVLRDDRSTAPRSSKGTVYQATAWMRATDERVSGRFKL